MKTGIVLKIFFFMILGVALYYLFIFYVSPRQVEAPTVKIEKKVPERIEAKRETKGRSIISLDSCDLKNYEMDCKIAKFLEENLAWTNNKEGIDFCSYEMLGEKDENLYIKAMCQEFYVSRGKIVCPNSEVLNKCFASKNKEGCSDCRNAIISPRLAQGGGVSIVARLTKAGDSFALWTPGDGSQYDKDIKAEVPSDIIPLISKASKDLQSINIERAEKYLETKAFFEIGKTFDTSCKLSIDCNDVPGEFAALSNCPHSMKCIDEKCSVGCYDLIDYEDLPVLED